THRCHTPNPLREHLRLGDRRTSLFCQDSQSMRPLLALSFRIEWNKFRYRSGYYSIHHLLFALLCSSPFAFLAASFLSCLILFYKSSFSLLGPCVLRSSSSFFSSSLINSCALSLALPPSPCLSF